MKASFQQIAAARQLGSTLPRSLWLDVWKFLIKTEQLLDLIVCRLSEQGNHIPKKAKEAKTLLAEAQEIRKEYESTWVSKWGNLTDFRLWAIN